MQTLGLGDCVVSVPRQRDSASRVLEAGPRQRGVEVVAAVEIDCAGVDVVDERVVGAAVLGPDRAGEAEGRVVDQAERLGVVLDLENELWLARQHALSTKLLTRRQPNAAR